MSQGCKSASLKALERLRSSRLSTLRSALIRSTQCHCVTLTRLTCGFWSQRTLTVDVVFMFSETLRLYTNSSSNTASAKKKSQPKRKSNQRKVQTNRMEQTWVDWRILNIIMVLNLIKKIHMVSRILQRCRITLRTHNQTQRSHRQRNRLQTQARSSITLSSSKSTSKGLYWSTSASLTSVSGSY